MTGVKPETRPAPVAVVTGAASGIGRALVQALLQRGYDCLAADVDAPGLAALAEAAGRPQALRTQPCDVRDAAQAQRLAEAAFAWRGGVDLLVNSAGVLSTGRVWDLAPEEWRRVLGINLDGVLHMVQAFMPRLLVQGRGLVLNVASMASLTAGADVAAYSVSKHGVLALSECLARDLLEVGSAVRVAVAFPGAVRTAIAERLMDKPAAQIGDWDRRLHALLAQGMLPEELATRVLDAALGGAFAIFTHDEVRDFAAARLAGLLAGELPGSGGGRALLQTDDVPV